MKTMTHLAMITVIAIPTVSYGAEAERNDDASLIAAAYGHVVLGPASETIPLVVEELLEACGLSA